jgi:hypothetical protein
VRGVADANSRQKQRPQTQRDLSPNGIREQRVGSEWKMIALVLDRPERHDRGCRPVSDQGFELEGGERLKLMHLQNVPPLLERTAA